MRADWAADPSRGFSPAASAATSARTGCMRFLPLMLTTYGIKQCHPELDPQNHPAPFFGATLARAFVAAHLHF